MGRRKYSIFKKKHRINMKGTYKNLALEFSDSFAFLSFLFRLFIT
jgi:hypothetical protein